MQKEEFPGKTDSDWRRSVDGKRAAAGGGTSASEIRDFYRLAEECGAILSGNGFLPASVLL